MLWVAFYFKYPRAMPIEQRCGHFGRNRLGLRATRGTCMAKKDKKPIPLPKKTYWHLYSLQQLESSKFVQIVNKVLKREYRLVK
ncbi:MAG: hypothetical protein D6800_03660 [Candidatus Zixiibacteriota bacterium]|nr:MAG: hypothetical protein D6800_03660 [candidate division Zixibacteria bacterium]